ncbi:MAG: segregation and condensation protein A [Patescibacteria group bacterium]
MHSHIIKLQAFEGPLDALLKIIEQQELDISEVSLAQVTDQYLAYIDTADINPTEIADFLQIAAKLLLIKSRILLPFTDELEDDDIQDLAEQLKEHKKFVEASQHIANLWSDAARAYSRDKLTLQRQSGFVPPKSVTVEVLSTSMKHLIDRLQPIVKLPEKTIRKVVSLREKIQGLLTRLDSEKSVYFHETLEVQDDSSEKIVSFLAMLELVKQRKVTVSQDSLFTDIIVKRL